MVFQNVLKIEKNSEMEFWDRLTAKDCLTRLLIRDGPHGLVELVW